MLSDAASHAADGAKFGSGEGGGVSSSRRHGEGAGAREHVGKKLQKCSPGRGGGAGRGGVSGAGWGWVWKVRGCCFHSGPTGPSQTAVLGVLCRQPRVPQERGERDGVPRGCRIGEPRGHRGGWEGPSATLQVPGLPPLLPHPPSPGRLRSRSMGAPRCCYTRLLTRQMGKLTLAVNCLLGCRSGSCI